MIGKYPAKLDDKNRLFVPAKLREELGDQFYVTLGVNCGHRCLTVYTAAEWQTLSDNFNNLSLAQRSGATSLIFMNATECSPDKQYRFSLTPFLLEYGGMDREVMIVGRAGQRFGTQRNLPGLRKRISPPKNCWNPWRRSAYERVLPCVCPAG